MHALSYQFGVYRRCYGFEHCIIRKLTFRAIVNMVSKTPAEKQLTLLS